VIDQSTGAGPVSSRFDPVSLEILWSRLGGIADEMWNTILRTSFSSIVSAALDFGCSILDAEGGQLIHAAASMPLFNLALPRITRDLLQRHRGRIHPGDVFIGNDPWLCCGHLPDVAVITPVFHNDRLVAFSASIAHQADFGGAHAANRVREVYEEGLFLPVMKLYERGARNETLFELIAANVRTPELVFGDLESQVAANEVGARRFVKLLVEYELDDPSVLVDELQGRSEQAMRAIIRDLPDGVYRAEGWSDSKGQRTKIAVAITIDGDEMLVDYEGTGDQLETGGTNTTLSFVIGETHHALKCLLAPGIPHNEGSTRPIKVIAPEGSILNCTFPIAVNARVSTALHIYPTINAALAKIVGERAQAANGLYTFPRVLGLYPDGRGYNAPIFAGGGQGGSRDRDGAGGYLFPTSCSAVSVELFEAACPVMITRHEWVADSAGAGQHRGGPAAQVVVRRLPAYAEPVRMTYSPMRSVVPAPGMSGGQDGTLDLPLWNGEPVAMDSPIRRDGWAMFRTDVDELTFHAPSGAGFGDPHARDRSAIEADIRTGLVTPEGAARDYGFRPRGA
jgi:N-methylhydantoinase B/oxoprolinase/acetone carboxylase alpha subunit